MGAFSGAGTLTTALNQGVQLVENGARWVINSQPAVSTQATASKAAAAGIRHVCDTISFSAMNTTAIAAAAQVQVNLRDGATGVGTVLWSCQLFIGLGPGQLVPPFSFKGLNLIGSVNTAMTLEFSALVTNLFESVTASGFDVQ